VVQQLFDFVQANLEETYPGTLQALIFATDKCKRNALQLAAERGHSKTIQLLLDFVQMIRRKIYWYIPGSGVGQ
jgi:hypothetical protein